MRVTSSLADIDFGIGRISRRNGDLVIESSDDSTLETTVTVSPREGLRSLWLLATSPSAWLYILTLPLALFGSRTKSANPENEWAERRQKTGLNKPW